MSLPIRSQERYLRIATRDHDEVGLSLSHTSGNGSYATLGYEFHADSSCGVDILQVEDELCQVLDTVDIVMWWRRDERDTGDGVTRLGDDLIHLEARQLSTLTRLSTLCHLDLYLFSIHQVFGCDTKTSTGNLFGLA